VLKNTAIFYINLNIAAIMNIIIPQISIKPFLYSSFISFPRYFLYLFLFADHRALFR